MSTTSLNTKKCDVLVIGGGAGAFAAVEASQDSDIKVILVSKGPVSQSGLTPTANGGTHTPPTPEKAFENIVKSGLYLSDQNVAWTLFADVQPLAEKNGTTGDSAGSHKPEWLIMRSHYGHIEEMPGDRPPAV